MGGAQDSKSMPGNMEDRQQMMEKRMDMMQMMMQMMMDAQPLPAAK
jgi:cytochrome c556